MTYKTKGKNATRESFDKFFNKNLNKQFIYEIIFEDKNIRHIASQLIRLCSFPLSLRIFKFLPSACANHVGQIYNEDSNWHFSEISPKQNYKIENFADFLVYKIKHDRFYGKTYIRVRDVKPENWNPSYLSGRYSIVAAILSGISGLILGIITYKSIDPLKIYKERHEVVIDDLKPEKVSALDFIKFILSLPLVLVAIPVILFAAISAKISKLLTKKHYQICSSMVDTYTGTTLDIIRSCSRVPLPQDWLLYGHVIRWNSEVCVNRNHIQGQDTFFKKHLRKDYAFVIEVTKSQNIQIKKVSNSILTRYLMKGAKYPNYLKKAAN